MIDNSLIMLIVSVLLGEPQSGTFGYYGPRISTRSLDSKYFDTNNLL